ncbi:MAG: Omp28-related outer membrane protein [Bacteroidetes bacterium]|nr:Omp28-related outer membrane protein [Bacteroidota bacterium]MBL6943487.1 Omp28-related outer membrane protein [Bacteroidales bacterium]
MKNVFTFLLIITLSTSSLFAQVIVGTDPENKNVVLEEFTGIHCVYCPQGHVIAQSIQNSHPDDVVLINIHQGSYANPYAGEPDFRTQWGDAIAGQSGLVGYPAGTVNRHLFPGMSQGSGTAMSRGSWTSASNQTLALPSYFNVGLIATVVTSTRQLVVEVEVYYTDDSPYSENYLNVAILQNNILGPQTGGNMGNNYNHMHMLRHLLTGQWGVEITETTEGSLYSETFLYEIPEDYTGVDVILANLDIVAFVSETHQEIISGNSAGDITYVESNDYDAALASVTIPQTACTGELIPLVTLKNYGAINLTSLEFVYSVNGGDDMTYSWTGNLAQNETEMVMLPVLEYVPTDNNTVNLRSELPNGFPDQLPQNDSFNQDVQGSIDFPENCTFMILVSSNPEDVTWSIVGENGETIAEGGPYSDPGFFINPFSFPETGCYELTVNDASGEGLSGGLYTIADENGDRIWTGTSFTYMAKAELAHGIIVDIDKIITTNDFTINPNPITNTANIEFNLSENADVNIAVFNILGKNVVNLYKGEMRSGSHSIQLNASDLNSGVYFVKIQMNNDVVVKKIMITK